MTTTKVYIGAVGEAFNSVVDARKNVAAAEKALSDAQTLVENAQQVYDKAYGLSDQLNQVMDGASQAYTDLENAYNSSENPEVHTALQNVLDTITEWDKADRYIKYDEDGKLVDGGNTITQGKNIDIYNQLLNDVSDNLQAAKDNAAESQTNLENAKNTLADVENQFKGMVPEDAAESTPAPETGDVNKDIAAETERIDKELDHVVEVSNGVQSTTDWIAAQLSEIGGDTGDDSQGIDDSDLPGEPWYYYVTECNEEDIVRDDIAQVTSSADNFKAVATETTEDELTLQVSGMGYFFFVAPKDFAVTCEPSVPLTIGEYDFDPDNEFNIEFQHADLNDNMLYKAYFTSAMTGDAGEHIIVNIKRQ